MLQEGAASRLVAIPEKYRPQAEVGTVWHFVATELLYSQGPRTRASEPRVEEYLASVANFPSVQ